MPDKIDTILEEDRWEIATKGLTGAYIAISNALKQAVGQKKFEEFNGALWHEAGKGAKEFADSFGLATENAVDVEAAMHLLAKASMGPEFQFQIVEATKDRCVGKTTECPWHKRWKEQGLDMDTCGAGHQAWGDGAAESLNPNFTFKLTKNMPAWRLALRVGRRAEEIEAQGSLDQEGAGSALGPVLRRSLYFMNRSATA